MKPQARRLFLGAFLSGLLAACGGGGGGGDGGGIQPGPQNVSAGGFWSGTVTAEGMTQDIFGMVSEARQFHFVRDDGAQYYGTLTINGNTGTSSFIGVAPPGTTFVDGSTRGTGSLTVTIQERRTLSVTGTFTTANNSTSNVTMTVQYDDEYEIDSALGTVAGNYTSITSPGADTLNINGGQVTYSDNTGCMANGTVSIINASYNLYNIEFTFANCPVQAQNGLRVEGLLTIDATQNPDVIIFALHGTVQGAPIALLFAYEEV